MVYATFNTDSFSTFIVTNKTPITSSSSGDSSFVTAPKAPEVSVDGNVVEISATNLSKVTINGENYKFTGNEIVIDMSQFENGTYEIVVTDKNGKTTTQTVVVANEVKEPTGGDDKKPVTPTVTPAPTQTTAPVTGDTNDMSFPWWILIVIAVAVSGYVYYRNKKKSK